MITNRGQCLLTSHFYSEGGSKFRLLTTFLWPCIFIVFSTNVLGVHLDTDLLFNTHAIETAKKANEKIYLTSKIKKYLTVDDALKA